MEGTPTAKHLYTTWEVSKCTGLWYGNTASHLSSHSRGGARLIMSNAQTSLAFTRQRKFGLVWTNSRSSRTAATLGRLPAEGMAMTLEAK